MLGFAKLLVAAMTASLASGGALLALTGSGPIGGGSDHGLDTDGDGAYDWLVVTMTVSVQDASYYNVWATLGTKEPFGRSCFGPVPLPMDPTVPPARGPFGDPMRDVVYPISWAATREFFEAGDHTVSLAFRGTDVGLAHVDGPYVVEAQVYADGAWGDPRILLPDRGSPVAWPQVGWTWTYVTRAYDADAFEQPRFAVRFTGEFEDRGLDLDGDGLFDYLVVEASADVALAGPYSYSAALMTSGEKGTDRPDLWVTGTWQTVELGGGREPIEARFNGGDVWASGHSGAFDFQLSIYYAGGMAGGSGIRKGEPYPPTTGEFDVYGDALCGTTASYRHEQFEERVEPATFTGVFADRGEDLDGDGLFDVLAVDAEVRVMEANPFEFSGQLMSDEGSTWIASDSQPAYLDVGVHTLTVRFSGPAIYASGVDGPYRVDLNLAIATRDPQTSYATGAYVHTDFDPDTADGTRTHWIANLTADANAISVRVVRGNDLLAYVIEDVLTVQAFARDGTLVFEATDKVVLPSGGNSQAFTFAWTPGPGVYLVQATLGPAGQPTDAVKVVVEV